MCSWLKKRVMCRKCVCGLHCTYTMQLIVYKQQSISCLLILKFFWWTHTYFCVYKVHFSLHSSVQRSFLRIHQGELYLKFVGKSNFSVTQSLMLRKSLLKWEFTKLKKVLKTGGKVDSQEGWNVTWRTWIKLKQWSLVVHRRFYTFWSMHKLHCNMRREFSESWCLQLNKSEICEMVRSWNCCRMISATSKVHYYMRNCKRSFTFLPLLVCSSALICPLSSFSFEVAVFCPFCATSAEVRTSFGILPL